MIKNTFLCLALISVGLLSSCKKNEGNKDNNGIDLSRIGHGLRENFSKSTPKYPANPVGKYPVMTFAKINHDFGTINQGDKVATVFEFTNTGNYDLFIYDAKGSCGCTIPEYPKTPIKPGAKGVIKVQFNSTGKEGKQNKSVYISTNSKKGNEVLEITANINKK